MSVAKQVLQIIAIAVVLAVLNFLINPKSPSYNEKPAWELSIAELSAYTGEILWVDARNQEAYYIEHIPGAILLDEYNWEAGIENLMIEWNGSARIVVYCDSQACHKSADVAKKLREDYSIPEVYYLKEGWEGWQRK